MLGGLLSFAAGIIAVIVVLLLIGFFPSPVHTYSLEPDKLMHDKLKDVVTQGYGCSPPTKAIIKRGTTIFAKQIRGDIVSIRDTDEFKFESGAAGVVGSGSTVGGTNGAKLVSAALSSPEAQIVFVVCGDTSSQPPAYKVCIDSKDTGPKVTGCKPDESTSTTNTAAPSDGGQINSWGQLELALSDYLRTAKPNAVMNLSFRRGELMQTWGMTRSAYLSEANVSPGDIIFVVDQKILQETSCTDETKQFRLLDFGGYGAIQSCGSFDAFVTICKNPQTKLPPYCIYFSPEAGPGTFSECESRCS
jgi:hypothetical protein